MNNKPRDVRPNSISNSIAVLFVGLSILSLAAVAESQNLIVNGDFDNDLSGWTPGAFSMVWSGSFDADDDPNSGSAFQSCVDPGGCNLITQCIPLPAVHAPYLEIGVSTRNVTGPGPRWRYQQFTGAADCSAGAHGLLFAQLPSTLDTWVETVNFVETAAADQSFRFWLRHLNARAAYWDNIAIEAIGVDVALSASAGIQGGGLPLPTKNVLVNLTLDNLDSHTGDSHFDAHAPQTVILFDPRLEFVGGGACPGSFDTLTANSVRWNGTDIGPSASSICTATFRILPGASPGDAPFIIQNLHADGDQDPSNNQTIETITISDFLDVEYRLATSPPTVGDGDTLDLELSIRNLGTLATTGSNADFLLPAAVSLVNSGNCTNVTDLGGGSHTLTFGPTQGGASTICTLRVLVAAGTPTGDLTIDGVAQAINNQFEIDPANNVGATVVTVSDFVYTVDDYTDLVDANPGDGLCASAVATCTLRAAIMESNALPGKATIAVPAILNFTYDLTLTSGPTDESFGDLDITDDVEILGFPFFSATGLVPINGLPGPTVDRVFHLDNNANVQMSLLLIQDGETANIGGGILVDSGLLQLRECVLRANQASSGGALANRGFVSAQNTLIEGNSATAGGGVWTGAGSTLEFRESTIHDNDGISIGGGLFVGGDVFTVNATISGNRSLSGGGLYVGANGDLDAFNTTIARNEVGVGDPDVGLGGGIFVAAGGQANLRNSIVDDNVAQLDDSNNAFSAVCSGTVSSEGHNVLYPRISGACLLALDATDTVASADLAPLAPNGGITPSHALLSESAAIDHGEGTECMIDFGFGPFPLTFDQRRAVRPRDGDGDTVATCDAGAFEQPVPILFGDGFESSNLDRWSAVVP